MSNAFEEDKWQRFSEWMAARGAKMVCHPANTSLSRTVGYLYSQNFSPNGQRPCFWRTKVRVKRVEVLGTVQGT